MEFAVRVGKAIDALRDTRLGRHSAGQFVRSGTSPAYNYAEAFSAESTKGLIHKQGIVLKELRERATSLVTVNFNQSSPTQD